jgi:hypothetical protein
VCYPSLSRSTDPSLGIDHVFTEGTFLYEARRDWYWAVFYAFLTITVRWAGVARLPPAEDSAQAPMHRHAVFFWEACATYVMLGTGVLLRLWLSVWLRAVVGG